MAFNLYYLGLIQEKGRIIRDVSDKVGKAFFSYGAKILNRITQIIRTYLWVFIRIIKFISQKSRVQKLTPLPERIHERLAITSSMKV